MIAASSRALIVIAIAAGIAHAQGNPTAADDAFKQGRELFKQNKFDEACVQFERSQQLDPAMGTLFNIGQCSERIGKLATAAAAYREVVAKDTNEQRKASAAERLKAIGPRVPRVYVKVEPPPPGIVVELEGKGGVRGVEANKPIEVDFGDYGVTVRARGYTEFMSRIKVHQEAKTTTVVALLKPGTSNSETIGVAKPKPEEPRSKRKLYGIGAMATGGGLIVGSVIVGVLARSRWNDAQDVCGGTCTTQADVDRANEIGDQARSKATLSTLLFVGGAAVGGVGAYLYFTAPGDTKITPTASETGAGVTLSGVF